MELFTIQCTTCRARLKVNDESVIGQILGCPKCGSMVQVVPPVGWKRDSSLDAVPGSIPTGARSISASDSAIVKPNAAQTNPIQTTPAKQFPAKPAPTNPAPAKAAAAAIVPTMKPAPIPPALPQRPAGAQATVKPSLAGSAPAAQPAALASSAAAQRPTLPPPSVAAAASEPLASTTATMWSIAAAHLKRDWMLWSGGLAGGIALGTTIWFVVAAQFPSEQIVATNAPVVEAPAQPPAAPKAEPMATRPALGDVEETVPAPEQPVDPTALEPGAEEKTVEPLANPTLTTPVDKPSPQRPVADKPVGSAIKLEPVPQTINPAAEAESEAAAESAVSALAPEADDAPAGEPNRGQAPEAGAAAVPASRQLSQSEIEERLSAALPTVSFVKVPLAQFLDFISDLTNLSITIDPRAIESLDKGRQTPVTVKLVDTTAAHALRSAVTKLGLSYSAKDGKIVISVK